MVPYADASDAELAAASLSCGTRLGTDASLAGVHIKVSNSSRTDARNRPYTVCTNGRIANVSPRPMSHTTRSRLRSHRSSTDVANAPKKKPGMRRADRTTPTATSLLDFVAAPASETTARKPSQSPNEDTHWAVNNRRYGPTKMLRSGRSPRVETSSSAWT